MFYYNLTAKPLIPLFKTNKTAQSINQKQFWIDKFTQEHLESLLINYKGDYFKLYKKAEYAKQLGKHILTINEIEKNREYHRYIWCF